MRPESVARSRIHHKQNFGANSLTRSSDNLLVQGVALAAEGSPANLERPKTLLADRNEMF